ncbi:MAG TPA: hypothetical protein V6D46_06155 [Coleofasciculaceae cyanobacterium]
MPQLGRFFPRSAVKSEFFAPSNFPVGLGDGCSHGGRASQSIPVLIFHSRKLTGRCLKRQLGNKTRSLGELAILKSAPHSQWPKIMPKLPIIQPDRAYSFADYFKLNFAPQDILSYFNVSLDRQLLTLPCYSGELDRLTDLKSRISESLPRISLNSEMARREFLIAPVLIEVLHYTEATLNVEYPIAVSPQLKGSLDYLLETQTRFLVIEAKNEDLERGFLQLAIEMIALDRWLESDALLFYGAISTGTIWQFGLFDRTNSQVIQDLNLYRVPADLEALLPILVGILSDGSTR